MKKKKKCSPFKPKNSSPPVWFMHGQYVVPSITWTIYSPQKIPEMCIFISSLMLFFSSPLVSVHGWASMLGLENYDQDWALGYSGPI
jgi:hypothetical protein